MIRKALLVITSLLFLISATAWPMGYSRDRININLTDSNMVDWALETWRLCHISPTGRLTLDSRASQSGRFVLAESTANGLFATVGRNFGTRFAATSANGNFSIAMARPAAPKQAKAQSLSFGPLRFYHGVLYGLGCSACRHAVSPAEAHNLKATCYAACWSMSCPVWLPVALFAVYPFLFFAHGPWRRWRRKRVGRCIQCGYDLRASPSDACPECGTTIVTTKQDRAPE